ncbi:MAG: ABC transporter permease [Firmicutes bacterium]|jgi:putative ABC transport system permease protein|nr:ABC transporter permease [Bacillota bacterium]NLL87883.1 ABC transporter permease [Bacillota bacterium]HKM17816.1 ABC transporter permease [Limnochordia bacterium]
MNSFVFTMRLIKKRPLRSLLTILQIALGVWIVATILTMNLQAQDQVNSVLNHFGENIIRLSLQREIMDQGSIRGYQGFSLSETDLIRLKQESTHIESVFTVEPAWNAKLKAHGLTYQVRGLAEVTAGTISALELKLLEGYAFTDYDQEQGNLVALISTDVSKQLFPDQSAVGKTIELESLYGDEYLTFEIIGVFEPINPLLQIFFQEMTIIIPLDSRAKTTGTERIHRANYSNVYVKSYPGSAHAAVSDAQVILASDDYNVNADYLSDTGRMFTSAIMGMSLFLGVFAFVAIIISSVGILSIMMVNVVERTREIGLRKALGASRFSIVIQVLYESLVFALLGAVTGIVGSVLSNRYMIDGLLKDFFFQSMQDLGQFHPWAAVYSSGLALIMGAIFGLYPAIAAARLPVVEALREA